VYPRGVPPLHPPPRCARSQRTCTRAGARYSYARDARACESVSY